MSKDLKEGEEEGWECLGEEPSRQRAESEDTEAEASGVLGDSKELSVRGAKRSKAAADIRRKMGSGFPSSETSTARSQGSVSHLGRAGDVLSTVAQRRPWQADVLPLPVPSTVPQREGRPHVT